VKQPLQLVAPWEPIDPAMAAKYEDEYATEIAKGHPLYGVPVRAVGRRNDCDDVLFELLRHLCDYAVVHLTWSGQEELDSRLPRFELLLHEELMGNCINPAGQDYEV
jgi:hypothetical protein